MSIQDKIDFALTYNNEIEKAITEKRLDPNLPKTGGGNSGHSRVSDPTCQKAMFDLLEIDTVVVYYGCNNQRTVKYPERWVELVKATRKRYAGTLQEKIIDSRFKEIPDKRNKASEDLGIAASYYSLMLRDIFTFAIGYAAGCGLK